MTDAPEFIALRSDCVILVTQMLPTSIVFDIVDGIAALSWSWSEKLLSNLNKRDRIDLKERVEIAQVHTLDIFPIASFSRLSVQRADSGNVHTYVELAKGLDQLRTLHGYCTYHEMLVHTMGIKPYYNKHWGLLKCDL